MTSTSSRIGGELSSERVARDLRGRATAVRSALVDDAQQHANLRDKLRSEVLPASWPELLYQFARGGLLLVTPEVDLLDVAEAMATDDRARIESFLAQGKLRRASDDDARTLQATPGQRLQFIIVQPWVIAQPL